MACVWNYKGHIFNTEVELDDFLLEKRPFESKLGDVVFSMSSAQLNVSSILSSIAKDSIELKKLYSKWREANNLIYDEDGEETVEAPPYIGVNKFLSGYITNEGNLLFPEFRSDEYWTRRFFNWKSGSYTNAELEEFGFNKDNPPKINDEALWLNMRKLIEHKWEVLARTGTAIHNVLLLIFHKENGHYIYERSDAEIKNYILSHIESKNKSFLNDTAINLSIEYAKRLKNDLEARYGTGLNFYTEFSVSLDTNRVDKGKPLKLFGIIDLLIVDQTGKVHILDYKTSIKDYLDFVGAKRLAFTYLLSVYQRMLEKYGINTYEGELLVSPIKISGFRRDGNHYIYDGIENTDSFIVMDPSLNAEKLNSNINEFMPKPFKVSLSAENIGKEVSKMMALWFPDYRSNWKPTKDWVIKKLKEENLLKPNDLGIYIYNKINKRETPITAKTKAEFVDKVLKYYEDLPATRIYYTTSMKSALKYAMKHGIKNSNFPVATLNNSRDSSTYMANRLSNYCDGNWEVVDNETLESYGIITVKSKDVSYMAPQVDFIRVSTNPLGDNYRQYLSKDNPLKGRMGLTGAWENDISQASKPDSLMLEAVYGNVELMETLLILNQTNGLEGRTVGRLIVTNPRLADSVEVTNEELAYCWDELNSHASVKTNNITTKKNKGSINLATKYEKVRQEANQILYAGEHSKFEDEYRYFKGFLSSKSVLDSAVDSSAEDKIKALQKVLKNLLNLSDENLKRNLNLELGTVATDLNTLSKPHVLLYNDILLAIADLKGINFRQQIRDHSKWLESLNILFKGASGTYIDNPGNLNSETLNLMTRLVTEAYQNTRDDVLRTKPNIEKLVHELKREKGFGALKENTVGNQASLYANMVTTTADGDFVFKNPNLLYGAERKFLEYALDTINRNRYPEWTDDELEMRKNNNDREYYRVPLALGTTDSLLVEQGLFKTLKEKLKWFDPRFVWQRARQKAEGVFNSDADYESLHSLEVLYQMTNLFDGGEDSRTRLDKILLIGVENLEHNLEVLLLKHVFAYSVLNNVNTVFPMIKAAMVHLSMLGAIRNREFSNDISYIKDYIKNKILNQAIVDPNYKSLFTTLGMIRSAASKFTLAFAPVQAIYLTILNLWVDVGLMIQQPDGKKSFTFNNFRKAFSIVYSDLAHFSDTPTVTSAFNETYAINDMDMNTYVNRISTSSKGWSNFENFMFKFASRPDYYHRMIIAVAQMLQDGSWDAMSIVNGKLHYDWKKDKRFEAFANGRVNDPKYNELKSLYFAVALLFVREHTKNEDGTEFVLNMGNPMPLPRAYTNREAESMKSLSDRIYGYYSHEKKSLVASTGLGAMWLLFKTFWSSKKNQYLLAGGVRLEGLWKQYEENGQKYYYLVDLLGNILYDAPPTTTPTVAPVMRWEGLWQEGVLVTLADMVRSMIMNKSFKKGWSEKWNNEDPRLKRAYLSNIKKFGYDMLLFLLGGVLLGALLQDWLDEINKESKKNRDFTEGLALAAGRVAILSVKNSFLDYNILESVGSPVGQWTPFAFEWMLSLKNNIWNVATGDQDFWDGVVNTFGGLKLIKPALDAIKPDMFRTKAEGGTFGEE